MGKWQIQSTKDSLITNFITNTGEVNAVLIHIFGGENAGLFKVFVAPFILSTGR